MQKRHFAPFLRFAAFAFAGMTIGAFSAAVPARAAATAAARQQWALLVGVGKNVNPENTLLGPANDVPAMREMLSGRYGFTSDHIRVVADAGATRQGILAGWEWLIQNAKPGDQVVFYYTGHGIDIADPTKPGGRDSALCPYDATNQAGLIPGSLIGGLIDRLKTDQVTVIVDACNSGSASRYLSAKRHSPSRSSLHLRALPPLPETASAIAPFGGQTNPRAMHKERYIGAARTDQSALECPFLDKEGAKRDANADDNPEMSALTYYLLQEVRAASGRPLTYDTLVRNVRRDLAIKFGEDAQVPQESGPGLATTPFLLAADSPAASSSLPIAVAAINHTAKKGDAIALRALAGAALTPGCVLRTTGGKRWTEVEDTPTATTASVSESGTGMVRVTGVAGSSATGVVLSGQVAVGVPLAEVLTTTPDNRLSVVVAVEGAAGDRIKALCKSLDHIEVVSPRESGDVTLSPSATIPGGIEVFRGAVRLLTVTEDKIPGLIGNFQGGKILADLQSPTVSAPGATPIHVTVQNAEGKEGSIRARIGEKATMTITVDHPAYITIIELASDGSITGVTLPDALVANTPCTLPPSPVEGPTGLDTIKVIATGFRPHVPLPANAAEVAQMGAESKPALIAQRVLEALRTQINDNHPKGFDFTALAGRTSSGKSGDVSPAPIAADGWAVGSIQLIVESAE